jgi:hypothetical protein
MPVTPLRISNALSSRTARSKAGQPSASVKAFTAMTHSGVLAWLAAVVGMLLFVLAGVAVVAHLVDEEQFWLVSAAGLAFYFCAHCLGISYHS